MYRVQIEIGEIWTLYSMVDVQLKFIVLLEKLCCVSNTDAFVDSGCSCLVADADRTLGKEDVAVDGRLSVLEFLKTQPAEKQSEATVSSVPPQLKPVNFIKEPQ
ncbi:hypothetical protein QQP08_005099 [Theobroma cacao]|nr:hypothetical protein QQP08_005099 [Theobroma cacao]